jgi:hypothetical protein
MPPVTIASRAKAIKRWAQRYKKGAQPNSVVHDYYRDVLREPNLEEEQLVRAEIARQAGLSSAKARTARTERDRKATERARQGDLFTTGHDSE